jgi:hypothetical protein
MEAIAQSHPESNTVSPGDTLLRTVRAAFVMRGDTLHAWCRRNSVDWSYAHGTLTGKNKFLKAQELRQQILTAAGLPGDR